MNTFQALSGRIKAATTRQELSQREAQITRHYDAGTIDAKELRKLDVLIMQRVAILATEES